MSGAEAPGGDEIIPIPPEALDPETLDAVIEDFILREGPEHGSEDTPIERKIAQVREQLRQGKAVLVFHATEESVRIVPAHWLKRQGGD